MSDTPTYDTPQERDDKAEILAAELRRFRWEARAYFLFVLAIVITGLI
jgi:hypothetical protein